MKATSITHAHHSPWFGKARFGLLMAFPAATLVAIAFIKSTSAQPLGADAPRKPPPEALAACKAMKSGEPCSFTGPRGAASGSCFTPSADKPLACRPKDVLPPPDGSRRPAQRGA